MSERDGLTLALGPKVLPALALAALCPALAEGLEVLWIDAGNAFAAHHLARTARDRGDDPRRVLARVRLSRPFTAFQLEALVCGKLPALHGGRPVILSDPLALFSGELAPPAREARRVFARVLEGLAGLKTRCLALAVPREPAPGCGDFPGRLERAARAVVRVEARTEGRLTAARGG